MTDFSKDFEIAIEAARAGAEVIKNNFCNSKKSWVKGDSKGLVTATDIEAEKAILDILKQQSEYEILSEESGTSNKNSGPKWIVDPLDGTNNFARSLPLFVVSIGLMKKNESLVGVIIDPINKKEYYAVKGGGAFCNNEKLSRPKFDSEYIPMLFLNHGYSVTDRTKFKELSNRLASSYNILKLGATALELCHVATGSGDGFICSGDELWDFAAGIVIAQEAGCIFTDWRGNVWDRGNDHLLITRPEIHEELVGQIKNLQ